MSSENSLPSKLYLLNFDTKLVTNMSNMFNGCSGLFTLNLSTWTTTANTNMTSMFNGCSNLQTLNLGPNFILGNTHGDMFTRCEKLWRIQLGENDEANASNIKGLLSGNWTYNPQNGLLTKDDPYWNTIGIYLTDEYYVINDNVATILIDKIVNEGKLVGCQNAFQGKAALTSIANLNQLNTTYVTDMSYMFDGCSALESLDLSSFYTSTSTIMNCMFQNCSSLLAIDLGSNFVLGMESDMFNGCTKLYWINIGKNNQELANTLIPLLPVRQSSEEWSYDSEKGIISRNPYTNTSKDINLNENYYTYNEQTGVATILINKIITEGTLKFCNDSFKTTPNVVEITNLHQLNTSQVTSMAGMFQGCTALT